MALGSSFNKNEPCMKCIHSTHRNYRKNTLKWSQHSSFFLHSLTLAKCLATSTISFNIQLVINFFSSLIFQDRKKNLFLTFTWKVCALNSFTYFHFDSILVCVNSISNFDRSTSKTFNRKFIGNVFFCFIFVIWYACRDSLNWFV